MMVAGIYPDDEYVRNVCKIGQRAACCRYLTMSPNGWSCEKSSEMRAALDRRVAAGEMSAQGDNCDGKGSR